MVLGSKEFCSMPTGNGVTDGREGLRLVGA
jgi:hypothetical protein